MTTEKVKFGVHSEAGKLRKVMVCSPGLAHQRLTPNNCDELLFDDVLWVAQAKRDHFDFVTKMRERNVDVLEMHNLLTDIVAIPEALDWILERKITANTVGLGLVNETSSWLRSHELVSFTRPRPTVLAVILRSRIQSSASGMATMSVSRLCISSTSTLRSRILVTKSKWSRLAWATHSTSSNSSSSQLLGVSRWWAKPGEHTMTLRSLPASECTPYFTFSVVITDPPVENTYRVKKPS